MSSNPFSLLYTSRPKLYIHSRARHYGSTRQLIDLAQKKGYDVFFEERGGAHDVRISEGTSDTAPMRSHSITSAAKYLQGHPGQNG